MRKREAMWFYVMVSPWVLGFLIFTVGPMIYSVYLSFTDWDLFNPPNLIGWDNFIKLFRRDKIF